jgi:putative ABC transport system permease protein
MRLQRLANLLRRRRFERELEEEMRYHIERQTDENIAKGMSSEDARSAAMRTFAGLDQRKEECRDIRRLNFVENLMRDVRYALRGSIKYPAFTCAAILTLSLGIGANAAVFTMVNSVLLRQLPFKHAERLVWIWSTRTDRDKAFYSIQNFIDTRARTRTLDDIAAFANWGVNLTGAGDSVRLAGVRISANAFEMLGVDAAFGRTLLPSDGTPGANRVVVISNGLWRTKFGADEHLIGSPVLLNGTAYTVVGVLPPQFAMPNAEVEIASPLVFETDPQRSDRGSNFLRTFARLKPHATPSQAQAELTTITEQLKHEYPNENAKHTAPRVLALRDEVVGSYHALLWTLLGAVGIVLLIACTNLANMTLVRSAARKKDFAIRTALGGSRAQLTRELMTASILLAMVGGVLGLVLASWGVRLLIAIGPADLPRVEEVVLDWRVVAFAACLSLVIGMVFGLIPSMQTNRMDLNRALKSNGRSSGENSAGVRIRRLLVMSEIALSLLLLVGTGLLIRSFIKLQSVSAGVDTRNVLSARLSLPATKYAQSDLMIAFVDRLLQKLRHVPGVRSVSMGSVLPLSGMNTRADFSIAGRPPLTEEERPAAQNRWVAPNYFRTMGIPLFRGRDFNDLDTQSSQSVVVIDEELAKRHFPSQDPLGMHLRVGDSGPNAREVEIVGVVGGVKHFNLDEAPTPTYYSPIAQVPQPALGFLINGMSLVVRAETEPLSLANQVRREIESIDNDVPASAVRTMDELLAASVAPRRFNLLLIEIFAGAALVLAAMGLYSVIAYTVVQRKHEIGIRMALGANASEVFKHVLREGLLLTIFGEAAGLTTALITTRFLSRLLFGVTPTDALTFGSITVILASVALVACYIPARRATSVDPCLALRNE